MQAIMFVALLRICVCVPADKVYMTLVPRRALSMCSRACERYQGLQFVLRSDLCDLVRVGCECEVIGVPTHSLGGSDQHSAVRTQVEVNMQYTYFGCYLS